MTDKRYIQMFSVHGLVRYENMELGRDADTGGQVKYVIEMAEALGRHESVRRVDLFTRLISDKRVSEDYSRPVEEITDSFRIIRIQCGGKQYMRKELLWPHLDEFIDKTIRFIKKEGDRPDLIHGHYPDAGYICLQLSDYFQTPFIFTGHSLGRPKKQKLLNDGMKEQEIDRYYKIEHRIQTEEEIIQNADLIVTSTRQEIDKQYGMYDNKNLPTYAVIPPGVNLEKFYPFYYDMMPEKRKEEEILQARASIMEELSRFLLNPDKPLVLALCRADKRKNISGLIDAFGKDKELQAMANLAIFAGIRKDITDMGNNEKDVLTEMLLLMDKYDLYGKMAIPKKHDFTYEVPELYRLAAEKKGVFVNIAFTEPFGLTLIEASACGLPIVATDDGGPRDILANCHNGFLVEPTDHETIGDHVKELVSDADKWKAFSGNGIKGVNDHYNWEAHVDTYIQKVSPLLTEKSAAVSEEPSEAPVGSRLTVLKKLLLTDIDNTLTGDDAALAELMEILREHREEMGFGVVTGRCIDEVIDIFERYDLMTPDVVIPSVGSEIFYRLKTIPDRGWQSHIAKNWDRKKIKRLLDGFDFLTYRGKDAQNDFKVAYTMESKKDRLADIHDLLSRKRCRYNLIFSHDRYLDVLPLRASKAKAIRYLSYKWEIPMKNILVCGDGSSDAEMLKGTVQGVVVANHSKELDSLKGKRKIYFAEGAHAKGVIEGLKKFKFI